MFRRPFLDFYKHSCSPFLYDFSMHLVKVFTKFWLLNKRDLFLTLHTLCSCVFHSFSFFGLHAIWCETKSYKWKEPVKLWFRLLTTTNEKVWKRPEKSKLTIRCCQAVVALLQLTCASNVERTIKLQATMAWIGTNGQSEIKIIMIIVYESTTVPNFFIYANEMTFVLFFLCVGPSLSHVR